MPQQARSLGSYLRQSWRQPFIALMAFAAVVLISPVQSPAFTDTPVFQVGIVMGNLRDCDCIGLCIGSDIVCCVQFRD